MKKITFLLSCFILLSAFTCENESLDNDIEAITAMSCEDAVSNMTIAASNFSAATEENYTSLCTAFKLSLQAQIIACGDPNGSIQDFIDALVDCTINVEDLCANISQGVLVAEAAYNNAPDSEYEQTCFIYKVGLQNQIEECGDEDGSIQDTIDSLGDCSL